MGNGVLGLKWGHGLCVLGGSPHVAICVGREMGSLHGTIPGGDYEGSRVGPLQGGKTLGEEFGHRVGVLGGSHRVCVHVGGEMGFPTWTSPGGDYEESRWGFGTP